MSYVSLGARPPRFLLRGRKRRRRWRRRRESCRADGRTRAQTLSLKERRLSNTLLTTSNTRITTTPTLETNVTMPSRALSPSRVADLLFFFDSGPSSVDPDVLAYLAAFDLDDEDDGDYDQALQDVEETCASASREFAALPEAERTRRVFAFFDALSSGDSRASAAATGGAAAAAAAARPPSASASSPFLTRAPEPLSSCSRSLSQGAHCARFLSFFVC